MVERANHSRPSGYIRMGLDATVVYPYVDLKLRNPYDFPIAIHAAIDRGTLAFTLHGSRRPATVSFDTATVGTAAYKRKIEEVSAMPEGKVVLKQRGRPGISIKKTRTIQLADGSPARRGHHRHLPRRPWRSTRWAPAPTFEALPPLPEPTAAN